MNVTRAFLSFPCCLWRLRCVMKRFWLSTNLRVPQTLRHGRKAARRRGKRIQKPHWVRRTLLVEIQAKHLFMGHGVRAGARNTYMSWRSLTPEIAMTPPLVTSTVSDVVLWMPPHALMGKTVAAVSTAIWSLLDAALNALTECRRRLDVQHQRLVQRQACCIDILVYTTGCKFQVTQSRKRERE